MVLVPPDVAVRKERRRVRIACSACAARKLRCDGLRPCGRCVNLQLADSCQDREISTRCRRPRHRLQAPACSACSYSKVACSAERPCPRCVRLGLGRACIASTLQPPRRVPRTWAYELVPLVIDLPFPRTVREFWTNWPSNLTPHDALSLALSPERLDKVIKAMLWAVTPDDVCTLRRRFDSLKLTPDVNIQSSSDQAIQCSEDEFTPALPLPDTPEISYNRNDSETTLTMNRAAFSVLGYSTEMLKEAVTKSVHCYENDPNYLPFIYKLFHPDSWLIISCVFLKYYLFHPKCQRFICQLARCDGRPVPVYMAMSIWVNELHHFRTKMSFTTVDATFPTPELDLSLVAEIFN